MGLFQRQDIPVHDTYASLTSFPNYRKDFRGVRHLPQKAEEGVRVLVVANVKDHETPLERPPITPHLCLRDPQSEPLIGWDRPAEDAAGFSPAVLDVAGSLGPECSHVPSC